MNLQQKLAKYPKLGEWKKQPSFEKEAHFQRTKQGKKCLCCDQFTNGKRFVQVNFFRGDDELIALCSVCKKKPEKEIVDRI